MPQTTTSAEVVAAGAAQDPREVYWRKWLELVEQVEVYERMADRLARNWGRLPATCSLLTALSSTTSGIAGWAVWSSAQGKVSWAVLAGLAAILSIVSTTLGFSAKTESYANAAGKLSGLRKRLYSFQSSSLRRSVPIDDKMQDRLDAFEAEWNELPVFRADVFNTKAFQTVTQQEVEAEYKERGWLL